MKKTKILLKGEVGVSQIKQHMKRSPYPIIICGDFNDTPDP